MAGANDRSSGNLLAIFARGETDFRREGANESGEARIPEREKRDKWALAARGAFTQRELDGWRDDLIGATALIERALASSDWLVEDGFSLADIAVFSMANGLPRLHPDILIEDTAPRAFAWLERMRARPGVATALSVPTLPAQQA